MNQPGDRLDEALGVIGRLVLFAVVALATLFLSGVALKPFLPLGLPPGREGRMLFLLLVAFALVAANLLTVAIVDRARWSLTGVAPRQWSLRWMLVGTLAGGLAILAGASLLLLRGALVAVPSTASGGADYALDGSLMILAWATIETLVFRGYLFGVSADRWGAVVAGALSAAAFAFFHVSNPMATLVTLPASFALGAFLAVVRWRGGLVAAWLAQVAAGLTAGELLRLPVWGLDTGHPTEWRLEGAGAEWLSGGAWGIDGGAAVTLTMVLVTFVLLRVPSIPQPHSR